MNSTLLDFIHSHQRLLVITGAGVSTASGIPDYRDENGAWKPGRPIYFQDFIQAEYVRQRYWARSALGWNRFAQAAPGAAHQALARLETEGRVSLLITQNVDRLHQRAGSQQVIDLHGALEQVVCLGCNKTSRRIDIQDFLLSQNEILANIASVPAPDGDVQLPDVDFSEIVIPYCDLCGGTLKPDVVFFGENVPGERVQACYSGVENAEALLVIGSTLMVYSSFRFVRRAHEMGIPIVAINRGVTRADDLLQMKVQQDCGLVLKRVVQSLGLAD